MWKEQFFLLAGNSGALLGPFLYNFLYNTDTIKSNERKYNVATAND